MHASKVAFAGICGGQCARFELETLLRPLGAPPQQRDKHIDACVRATRSRVALSHHLDGTCVDFEAFDLVDSRFIDSRVDDGALVRCPPIPGLAIHLFLRDELRHAEGD